MRTSATLFAVIGLATLCGAGPMCASPQGSRAGCWDTAKTQLALNECAGSEFQGADRDLNATYQKVLAKFQKDPARTAMIKKSQRAWVAFRDAEVKALYPYGPGMGSVTPMCAALERTNLTKQRTEQLKKYLSSTEGDVCGP